MSSKFLDIPGRKQITISSSSEDDDHSFIILSSSGARSQSYDNDIEVISESPIMEIGNASNRTDFETFITSELGEKDNELFSIPEICESLMATIQPGMVITSEENYSNVLKENLEDIILKFEQMKGQLVLTRKLLSSQIKLRQDLLEKSKEVMEMRLKNNRVEQDIKTLSYDLKRTKHMKSQLLKKLQNMRLRKDCRKPRKDYLFSCCMTLVIFLFCIFVIDIMLFKYRL